MWRGAALRPVRHLGVLRAGARVVRFYRNGGFIDHRRDFSGRFPARLTRFTSDNLS
jgi:hypothetical protein